MEYVVDVTSPKVQEAMRALKISTEDLQVKKQNSFLIPGVPQQIQLLRFKYHAAKSHSLVNQINDYLMTSSAATPYTSKNLISYHRSAFRDEHNNKFKKAFERRIHNFYEFEKTCRKTESELMKRNNRNGIIEQKIQELVKGLKEKNEAKVVRQKENMRSVRREQEFKVERLLDKINRTQHSCTPSHIRETRMRTRSVMSTESEDLDVDYQLENFNRKMMRSSENYEKVIRSRVERLKNSRQKARPRKSYSFDCTELIQNMINKREKAGSRRDKLKKEFNDKMDLRGLKMLEKMQKVNDISLKEKILIEQQKANLKEKSLKTLGFMEQIKKKQREQIEYMQEKHRLLEEGAANKIYRQKKITELKREKIIEKHIDLDERQRQYHMICELANRKAREKAMNFTMQKEKVFQFKSRVSKSSTPERAKIFLETI